MKWLKIIGLSLASLALLLFASLFLISKFYQDELVQLFTKEINKQLRSEIGVKDIQLNAFKHFPKASIQFEEVFGLEPNSNTDTLFKANSLSLSFNWSNFINGEYKVDQLAIEAGYIRATVSSNGVPNYKIWKENTEQTSSFQVSLEQILLKKLHFSYRDFLNQEAFIAGFHDASIQGNLDQSVEKLSFNGSFDLERLRYGDVLIEENIPVKLKAEGLKKEQAWHLNVPSLAWRENQVQLKGEYSSSKYQISLSTEQIQLSEILSYLPKQVQQQLNDYQVDALIGGTFKLSGNTDKSPRIVGDFNIAKGKFTHSTSNTSLSDILASGSIDYQTQARAELIVNTFSAELNKGKVEGDFAVKNFLAPDIMLSLNTELNWKDLFPFLGWDNFENVKGKLNSNVQFTGKFSSWEKISKAEINAAQFTGKLSTEGLSFKLAEGSNQYENIQAKLDFNNQELIIHQLNGNINNSDFELKGACKNLLSFLLQEGESLELQAALSSKKLNLDEILKDGSDSDSQYNVAIHPRIKAELSFSCGEFQFRRFEAKNISAQASINKQVFQLNQFALSTLDGKISGSLRVDARYTNLLLSGTADIEKIDVSKAFYSFENVGQSYLQDQHLKGIATADIVWSGLWTRNLDCDLSKLKVHGDIRIDQGELINFEPLQALSGYVNLEELKHVRFQTLENSISIEDQKVVIPQMSVRSSALTMDASGTHYFDNRIKYNFRLLLSEILTKKVQDQEPKLYGDHAVIEDDGLRTSLYLVMTGTVDEPIIKYDKQSLKQKIQQNFKEEGQEIKQMIKEEFKEDKPDTSKSTPIKNTEFIIEWDDEDPQ